MKLIKNKSYAWLWTLFAVPFVIVLILSALRITSLEDVLVLLAIEMGYVLFLEIRSGIA